MTQTIKFRPLSFSWVAIHPNPKGVIQFIGGAFFGTFPTFFYPFFFQRLFDAGYTIVALPFRFSFRHWLIAIDLLREQEAIRKELLKLTAQNLDLDEPDRLNVYADTSKYFWIGHSLGCKYIALLELISDKDWERTVDACTDSHISDHIKSIISSTNLENASILNQSSILIAPDISDTESAIPIAAIAKLIDRIGLGVLPTRAQTQCFIAGSSLFNLTRMISFDKDTIAGNQSDLRKNLEEQAKSDVLWFMQLLDAKQKTSSDRPKHWYEELHGKHLEPLGVRMGNYIVDFNLFDKFIKPLKYRQLEEVIIKFLASFNFR